MFSSGSMRVRDIVRSILAIRLGKRPDELDGLTTSADWDIAWEELYANRPGVKEGQGR
jgi:hypothetical protein